MNTLLTFSEKKTIMKRLKKSTNEVLLQILHDKPWCGLAGIGRLIELPFVEHILQKRGLV